MQHKWFVLLAGLVLLSLLIAPMGVVGAQVEAQASAPDCPSFESEFVKDPGFLKSLPPECAKAYLKTTRNVVDQATQPVIMPLAVGGPDAFGYTYDDAVSYSWIAASTNTGLSGDDEVSGAYNIGFNFPFYGINYSQLYFTTNGGITFGSDAYQYEYGGFSIPNTGTPNNLIAPFWEDLLVGSPDNAGAIYYSQGGSAPNRYFVMEWRNVTTYEGSSAFSFETILYENGDIVIQHQSLPASYYSTVGIENSVGNEGLQYQRGSSGLSAPKAIRFYYPTTPTARVLISPLEASAFSASGGTSNFVLTVTNTGSLGTDTYDLTSASSWPVSYYAMDGITSLTDTDLDGAVDTDSLSIGSSVTITVKITPPGGTAVGDINNAIITVRSSLNTSKLKTFSLLGAIPAPFAQVYRDDTNSAMSLDLIQPSAQVVKKATADGYYGTDGVVTLAPNGNFVYIWTKYRNLGSAFVFEIEYTLLDHYGNTIRAVSKLTDHSGAITTTGGGDARIGDYSPSIAVTPNGAIGVTWYRRLFNAVTSQFNDNIYFATLDASGHLVTGPTNITNNGIWGGYSDLNIPNYVYPTIAATSDNRFILSWEDFREVTTDLSQSDFWYATYNSTGATVFAPALLTHDHNNYVPTLNSVTNGNVILTYKDIDASNNRRPYYMIINSSGAIVKSETSLGNGSVPWYPVDAVLLSNGKVAAAWGTDTGIGFSILDSTYTLESGPTVAASPSSNMGDAVSVTTDIDNHVIITWYNSDIGKNLLYALGDSAGNFITPPMSYKTSAEYIGMSWNGQGNAPYSLPDGVDGVASLNAELVSGKPGDNVSVGVHTTNHGADTATGVVLTVTLDTNLTYVSDTSGIVPNVVGNTVTWNLPNLTSLSSQDFNLVVGIASGATLGTYYPISLSLNSNEPDINPGDNTDIAEALAALLVYLPLTLR